MEEEKEEKRLEDGYSCRRYLVCLEEIGPSSMVRKEMIGLRCVNCERDQKEK